MAAAVVLPLPEAMGAEHSTLAVDDEAVALNHVAAAADPVAGHPSLPQPQQHHGHHQHRQLQPGGPFKCRAIFGSKQRVALHHAVQDRNLASVRQLLEYLDSWASTQPGPDAVNAAQALVNSFDSHQMTPLMLACQQGASEATRLLLDHGADPLLADRAGNNGLHLAARAGHAGCIQELLAWQERHQQEEELELRLVNSRNGCGYTPLHFAVWARCREGAEQLLAAGASLAARNTMQGWDLITAGPGSTPLHLAAHRGSTSMSKTLLSAYLSRGDRTRRIPDPRLLPNGEGRVPYEVALLRGRAQVLPVLNPATEWQEIFGEGADVAHLFSPASLAEMAAAQLRWKLLGELDQIESAGAHTPTRHLTRTLSIPLRRHLSGPNPLCDPCCAPPTTPPATPDPHATRSHTHQDPFASPPQGSPLSDCHMPCSPHSGAFCSAAPSCHAVPSGSCDAAASCSAPGCTSLAAGGLPLHTKAASCSSCSSNCWAAAGVGEERQKCDGGCSSEEEEEEEPCGICLEAGEQLVHMQPCRHFTCVDCMKQLLNTVKLGAPPVCPFCRGYIGGLQ